MTNVAENTMPTCLTITNADRVDLLQDANWSVAVIFRKYDGKYKKDAHYLSPTGQRLRSKPEVRRWLVNNHPNTGFPTCEYNAERLNGALHALSGLSSYLKNTHEKHKMMENNSRKKLRVAEKKAVAAAKAKAPEKPTELLPEKRKASNAAKEHTECDDEDDEEYCEEEGEEDDDGFVNVNPKDKTKARTTLPAYTRNEGGSRKSLREKKAKFTDNFYVYVQ